MIITCDKCSTRFNLDDTMVKADGSKVRCSVCKNIFTAYPPSPEPVEIPEDTAIDETPEFGIEENDFSLEDSDVEYDASDLEMEESPSEEPEVSPLPGDEPESSEPSELEMDLETDDGPALEIEDDFDFEEDEPEMESDEADEAGEDDDGVVGLDMDDDDDDNPVVGLEMDDDADDDGVVGLEMDEDVSDDEASFDEDEFDGLEFEPLEDDDPALEMEDVAEFQMEEPLDEGTAEPEKTGEPVSDDEDFELEFDIEDEPEELSGTDAGDEIQMAEPEMAMDAQDDAEEITPEEDFNQYDDVLKQETEPDEEEDAVETVDMDTPDAGDVSAEDIMPESAPGAAAADAPPVRRSRRRKKKSILGGPVLILLLLFLLIAGAWVASLMTGYKIPYLSDVHIPFLEQILKPQTVQKAEIKPVPNQKSVNGRFVNNTGAGTLFVITGTVDNPSADAFSHIRVKGALITQGKVEAKTKEAYCGNIIPEETLKTGTMEDIDKALSNMEGTHGANANVKPGGSIPFMVVFAELPDKLQNFTVKVVSSEKVQKGPKK